MPTAPSKIGYHGEEGYRRNTPDLRLKRSVFDYEGSFNNNVIAPSNNEYQSHLAFSSTKGLG